MKRYFSNKKLVAQVKGTKDYLGIEAVKFNTVERKSFKISNQYGYQKVTTSLLQKDELFKRPLGESSDIVSKESLDQTLSHKLDFLYANFEMIQLSDYRKSQKGVVLIPEGTSPVLRAFLEPQNYTNTKQRLSYVSPMFRNERPQRGRQRQFYQFGLEIINTDSILDDFETIKIADSIAKELLPDTIIYQVEINNLGSLEERNKYRDALLEYYSIEGVKSLLSETSLSRMENNPLRILDSKEESDIEVNKNAPKIQDFLNPESLQETKDIQKLLEDANIPFKFNPFLVRGLDYYNGICFELMPTSEENYRMSTLIAGGRYDSLANQLHPKMEVKACGFALGIERFMLQLDLENDNKHVISPPLKIALINLLDSSPNNYDIACINQKIRDYFDREFKKQDYSCSVISISQNQISKRLNQISKEYNYALVLGSEEIKSGKVELKNLETRKSTIFEFQYFENGKN